jgi:hypothetical protein
MLRYAFILLFVLLGSQIIQMLNLGFSHEVGVIAGPVAFQSDYGERYNLTPMPEYRNGNRNNSLYKFSYKAECNYTLIPILTIILN